MRQLNIAVVRIWNKSVFQCRLSSESPLVVGIRGSIFAYEDVGTGFESYLGFLGSWVICINVYIKPICWIYTSRHCVFHYQHNRAITTSPVNQDRMHIILAVNYSIIGLPCISSVLFLRVKKVRDIKLVLTPNGVGTENLRRLGKLSHSNLHYISSIRPAIIPWCCQQPEIYVIAYFFYM